MAAPEHIGYDVTSAPLAAAARAMYPGCMSRLFDIEDRSRLRERFFGATRTVLARL